MEKKEETFIITLKRTVFYEDTVGLSVTAVNKEKAERAALKYARKHADDGVIEWSRELASKAPRVTIKDTTIGEIDMKKIPNQTATDLGGLEENDDTETNTTESISS